MKQSTSFLFLKILGIAIGVVCAGAFIAIPASTIRANGILKKHGFRIGGKTPEGRIKSIQFETISYRFGFGDRERVCVQAWVASGRETAFTVYFRDGVRTGNTCE